MIEGLTNWSCNIAPISYQARVNANKTNKLQ